MLGPYRSGPDDCNHRRTNPICISLIRVILAVCCGLCALRPGSHHTCYCVNHSFGGWHPPREGITLQQWTPLPHTHLKSRSPLTDTMLFFWMVCALLFMRLKMTPIRTVYGCSYKPQSSRTLGAGEILTPFHRRPGGFDALGRCSMCMPSERWLTPCSLWVNRQGLPLEAIGPRPRYVASDLTKVLDVIA